MPRINQHLGESHICNDSVTVVCLDEVLDFARGSGTQMVAADEMVGNIVFCGIGAGMTIGEAIRMAVGLRTSRITVCGGHVGTQSAKRNGARVLEARNGVQSENLKLAFELW